MYGVTDKGFRIKPLSVIRDEIRDRMKTRIGEDVATGPDSIMGQIIDNYSWEIYRGWQAALENYNNSFVSTARGVALDRLCEHIGITRRNATSAAGNARVYSDTSGIVIPEGLLLSADDGAEYETTGSSTANVYDVVDNIDYWYGVVGVKSVEPGADKNLDEGAEFELVNPDSNLQFAVADTDISGGVTEETDNELRRRYFLSVDRPGGSTLNSIRANIIEVAQAIDVKMLENTTDATDDDGLPPHSFEPIILFSGETTPELVGGAILDKKPAGISSHGEESVSVTDDSGEAREIGYTEATKKLLYIELDLQVDPEFSFDAVADEVKDEIISYIGGNTTDGEDIVAMRLGEDIIFKRIYDYIFNVSGVIDVSGLGVSLDDGTTYIQENVSVGAREFSFVNSENISIGEMT